MNILPEGPITTDSAEHLSQRLSAIVESSNDAIISKNLEGIIQSWNRAAERIFGYTADEIVGKSILTLFPAERRHEETDILAKIRRGERIEHYETLRRRKDGTLIDVSITVSPLFDAEGRVVGASKIARDVSGRRRIDSMARHFAAIVESSEDTIISKDLNGIIQSWNKAAERMFGYTAEEIVGKPVLTLIPEERHHEEDEILSRIRRDDRIEHFETVRRRKDGSLVEISLTISPVKDEYGRIVGASKIARDITGQKEAERLLRQQTQRLEALNRAAQLEIEHRKRAEAARELLLHEIKHRVKNTLGTVQAMASQTFREAPRAEKDAFVARLQALSEAHDLLTQRNWDTVTTTEIIERSLAPFCDGRAGRVTLSGPSIELSPNKGLLIALLLHELGTNAVKYGALSNLAGTVSLMWHEEQHRGKRCLELLWREQNGPAVIEPRRRGFGTQMIERALQAERGKAEFAFEPAGLIAHLWVGL